MHRGFILAEGDVIEATEFVLRAIHTPGHASNHLCFLLEQERMLFSGDHIMEGSTVVIAPPDGDMGDYLRSLDRLTSQRPRIRSIAPGHGHLIEDPQAKIDEYVTHRLAREAQVAQALRDAGTIRIEAVVKDLYADVPEELHVMAAFSVWAHLQKLAQEGRATGKDLDGEWTATSST